MALADDRDALLEKYGPYVRSLAAQVRRQFSMQFEMDELVAWGQIGLLEAADRFDDKVGANFLTFAHYRIKGAIYDGLRKMGVLRGSDARTAYAGERSAAYLGNLADRDTGGGNRRGSFDDDVRDISSAVTGLAALLALSTDASEGLGMDEGLAADERLELEQQKKRLRAALEQLPEKERALLEGYYFQGKTLEDAGAEIGQSKSWASRLHARAVERLKDILAEDDESPPATRRQQDGGTTHGHRIAGGAGRTAEGTGASAAAEAGRKQV